MPLVYGIGGQLNVAPGPIQGEGPPPENFKGQLGQFYFDISTTPYTAYIYDSVEWQIGGNALATTTSPGIVEIDDDLTDAPPTDYVVPSAMAAKSYIDSIAIAGAPAWDETTAGIGEIATTAEAIAATDDTVAMTPLKMAQMFASPPSLGVLTGGAAKFTTLTVNFSALFLDSIEVQTQGQDLNIGSDGDSASIFIGTGAGEREISIGNDSGTTSVTIDSGTSPVNIATSAVAHTINIGNTTGATEVNLSAGTGGVNLVTDLNLNQAATKIGIKGGSATDFIGSATLVGGRATIVNPNILATDRISLDRSDLNGSPALGFLIYTINPGVNFLVASADSAGVLVSTDVSSFTYVITRQI